MAISKVNDDLVGGFNQPLWKIWVKVSRDDEIPNWMESHKIPWFQSPPTSEPMDLGVPIFWPKEILNPSGFSQMHPGTMAIHTSQNVRPHHHPNDL